MSAMQVSNIHLQRCVHTGQPYWWRRVLLLDALHMCMLPKGKLTSSMVACGAGLEQGQGLPSHMRPSLRKTLHTVSCLSSPSPCEMEYIP